MFTLLSLLAAFTAHADPGSGGMIFPDAAPLEGDTVELGVAAAGGFVAFTGNLVGLGAEASWGITDRVSVHALVLPGLTNGERPFGLGSADVRWLAVDLPAVRVAPYAYTFTGTDTGNWTTVAAAGIAVDAGSEVVRVDLSAPAVGVRVIEGLNPELRALPLLGELGVSFRIADQHRLRLGAPTLLSYRYQSDRAYVDAGVLWGGIAIGLAVKTGVRF